MVYSDPISESTPRKRQKQAHGVTWDSENDSGEELTMEDFEPAATVATVPLASQKRKLRYTTEQFHKDTGTEATLTSSQMQPHVTQPTQFLPSTTQPTQMLPPKNTHADSTVLVDRSSPPLSGTSPPPKSQLPSLAKRGSILASVIAPAGTSFRRPLGVQPRPAPVDVDSDEDDPPIHHSSDEETQGLNNIRPTVFKKGGRVRDSTPDRRDHVIQESPAATSNSTFANMMSKFTHSSPSGSKPPPNTLNDSYPGTSRRPRPPPTQTAPSRAQPVNCVTYRTIDDVDDYKMRSKVREIQVVFTNASVQHCMTALAQSKANVPDAMEWMTAQEKHDAPADDNGTDELASTTPVARRGVAIPKAIPRTNSSQLLKPAAKQQVKAPSWTIAEKYRPTQASAHRPSQGKASQDDSDDVVRPKRRLVQGRAAARRSPTPLSSPPQQLQRHPKAKETIVISDDDSDSGVDHDETGDETKDHDTRLLKFFNECAVQDLVDLSNQPEDVVAFVLANRPFRSLDVIRTISNATETKAGKKSKSRPVGDKIVDVCSDMWTGYDAVDELVEQCERLAKPIQEALKSWGLNSGGSSSDGELQLMNLDEAHDSGVGTPTSSSLYDEISPSKSISKKSKFLSQPDSMNPKVTLKDYQLVGLNWLNLLWSKQLSCILADDMGLGKTCQVIAFLAHLQQQEVDGVHLIIVPGSTLENWLREFEHFAPQLNVVPYYGSIAERPGLRMQIEEEFDSIDVIVTTYDMAVKPDDNKFLRKSVDPMVCVYDEAHALRNPQSERYKQLTRIPATFRILLTGTPLQNNLQELVAILAFIMPELFAEKRNELQYIFQHKATTKDVDHAALLSAQRIARARSMMTPFILRRKKKQVLDLPVKHSRVEYCDMTDSQANFYADLIEEAQKVYADRLAGNTEAGGKSAIKTSSTTLTMLREAAIHPLLVRRLYNDKKIEKIAAELLKREWSDNRHDQVIAYLKGEHSQSFKGGDFGLHRFCAERDYLHKFAFKKNEWMDAGKVSKFCDLIIRFADNGDRTLVFSQWTSLMDILEAVLETLNIKFFRLDGSTNMNIRQDMIDRFADDNSIPVFMLSTKAGGAGINLACANKVIIFDSGFNPQDDVQAENRAHRVGQTRPVEVVRLVTRGTIEEQIHALGETKLALDERVAGEGATKAENQQAEKSGEQMVEKMFLESLRRGVHGAAADVDGGNGAGIGNGDSLDLKHAFKKRLENAGVKVASKQARF